MGDVVECSRDVETEDARRQCGIVRPDLPDPLCEHFQRSWQLIAPAERPSVWQAVDSVLSLAPTYAGQRPSRARSQSRSVVL